MKDSSESKLNSQASSTDVYIFTKPVERKFKNLRRDERQSYIKSDRRKSDSCIDKNILSVQLCLDSKAPGDSKKNDIGRQRNILNNIAKCVSEYTKSKNTMCDSCTSIVCYKNICVIGNKIAVWRKNKNVARHSCSSVRNVLDNILYVRSNVKNKDCPCKFKRKPTDEDKNQGNNKIIGCKCPSDERKPLVYFEKRLQPPPNPIHICVEGKKYRPLTENKTTKNVAYIDKSISNPMNNKQNDKNNSLLSPRSKKIDENTSYSEHSVPHDRVQQSQNFINTGKQTELLKINKSIEAILNSVQTNKKIQKHQRYNERMHPNKEIKSVDILKDKQSGDYLNVSKQKKYPNNGKVNIGIGRPTSGVCFTKKGNLEKESSYNYPQVCSSCQFQQKLPVSSSVDLNIRKYVKEIRDGLTPYHKYNAELGYPHCAVCRNCPPQEECFLTIPSTENYRNKKALVFNKTVYPRCTFCSRERNAGICERRQLKIKTKYHPTNNECPKGKKCSSPTRVKRGDTKVNTNLSVPLLCPTCQEFQIKSYVFPDYIDKHMRAKLDSQNYYMEKGYPDYFTVKQRRINKLNNSYPKSFHSDTDRHKQIESHLCLMCGQNDIDCFSKDPHICTYCQNFINNFKLFPSNKMNLEQFHDIVPRRNKQNKRVNEYSNCLRCLRNIQRHDCAKPAPNRMGNIKNKMPTYSVLCMSCEDLRNSKQGNRIKRTKTSSYKSQIEPGYFICQGCGKRLKKKYIKRLFSRRDVSKKNYAYYGTDLYQGNSIAASLKKSLGKIRKLHESYSGKSFTDIKKPAASQTGAPEVVSNYTDWTGYPTCRGCLKPQTSIYTKLYSFLKRIRFIIALNKCGKFICNACNKNIVCRKITCGICRLLELSDEEICTCKKKKPIKKISDDSDSKICTHEPKYNIDEKSTDKNKSPQPVEMSTRKRLINDLLKYLSCGKSISVEPKVHNTPKTQRDEDRKKEILMKSFESRQIPEISHIRPSTLKVYTALVSNKPNLQFLSNGICQNCKHNICSKIKCKKCKQHITCRRDSCITCKLIASKHGCNCKNKLCGTKYCDICKRYIICCRSLCNLCKLNEIAKGNVICSCKSKPGNKKCKQCMNIVCKRKSNTSVLKSKCANQLKQDSRVCCKVKCEICNKPVICGNSCCILCKLNEIHPMDVCKCDKKDLKPSCSCKKTKIFGKCKCSKTLNQKQIELIMEQKALIENLKKYTKNIINCCENNSDTVKLLNDLDFLKYLIQKYNSRRCKDKNNPSFINLLSLKTSFDCFKKKTRATGSVSKTPFKRNLGAIDPETMKFFLNLNKNGKGFLKNIDPLQPFCASFCSNVPLDAKKSYRKDFDVFTFKRQPKKIKKVVKKMDKKKFRRSKIRWDFRLFRKLPPCVNCYPFCPKFYMFVYKSGCILKQILILSCIFCSIIIWTPFLFLFKSIVTLWRCF